MWKDLLVVFLDEVHARSIGLSPLKLKIIFFTLLSACTVAALQTVGAYLSYCYGGYSRRYRLFTH